MAQNSIFIYVEEKNGIIKQGSLELINHTRTSLGNNAQICAICLSDKDFEESFKAALYEAGTNKIYHIKNEKLNRYNTLYYAKSIIQLIETKNPDVLLFPATKQGRDLAPKVSSELKTGLTADCTKLEFIFENEKIKLASTRPTFGGSLMATILCKTTPQSATVRENTFLITQKYENVGEFEIFEPNLNDTKSAIKIIEYIDNIQKNTKNLDSAQIILSGGVGLKTKENFEKLEKLALLMGKNVATAGSRPAIEKGFLPKEQQIGQTGKNVAPKIYIAFGISGAIQHICGVQNAQYIIAINNDKNAPIFKNCDIGIVEDAQLVIDSLICEYSKIHK